ncbi:MAG: hypothetical protein Q8L64_02910 [bacterium]|nr:hypothetical protein [bacterium]
MKRVATGLVLALVFCNISYAGQINSSLGYTASVPSNWLILTREEIRKNPDLFEDLVLQGVDKQLLNNTLESIKSGKVDVLFRKNRKTSTFADNINMFKQIQPTPSSDKDLKALCSTLPTELRNAFNRQVSVYGCEFRIINGIKTVYLDFDGVVPRTRSMQYSIPRSQNISLIVTATTSETTLNEVRKEFTEIMASFKDN